VRTVELGQFTEENAERIVERLETAGISWFVKRSGPFTRLISAADWGTRVFVDVEELDTARELARAVVEP
jgi:hypothetical protein